MPGDGGCSCIKPRRSDFSFFFLNFYNTFVGGMKSVHLIEFFCFFGLFTLLRLLSWGGLSLSSLSSSCANMHHIVDVSGKWSKLLLTGNNGIYISQLLQEDSGRVMESISFVFVPMSCALHLVSRTLFLRLRNLSAMFMVCFAIYLSKRKPKIHKCVCNYRDSRYVKSSFGSSCMIVCLLLESLQDEKTQPGRIFLIK